MKIFSYLLLTSISGFVLADVPQSTLEIKVNCLIKRPEIGLLFEIRNLGDRDIWIVPDTVPWAPSFRSNQFSVQVMEEKPRRLLGPLAFGHSVVPVKVLAQDLTAGVVQLDKAFPDLGQLFPTQEAQLSWRWQGLVSFSDRFKEFSPTSLFEGSLTIRSGACSDILTKRTQYLPAIHR